MPKILIVECMQEISSFNPVPSGYENFRVERGEALLAQRGGAEVLGPERPLVEQGPALLPVKLGLGIGRRLRDQHEVLD